MNSISSKIKADITRNMEATKLKLHSMMKEILVDYGERLIQLSPVGDPSTWKPPRWPKGYVPGTFVNNWQVGIDRPPTGIINVPDSTGNKSRARLKHLGRWQMGHTYYFVNNLPYAQAIEYGWSYNQAPAGVVAIATAELPDIVNKVVARNKVGPASETE